MKKMGKLKKLLKLIFLDQSFLKIENFDFHSICNRFLKMTYLSWTSNIMVLERKNHMKTAKDFC